MKYQKPEVLVVVSALDAVQAAMDKQPHQPADSTEILKTVSAYQADE